MQVVPLFQFNGGKWKLFLESESIFLESESYFKKVKVILRK